MVKEGAMPDAVNFVTLKNAPRLLMEAELKPIQGARFQPTGFADLGAAVYERADGSRMLLVESAQSVANRLEAACLEGGVGPGPIKELDGLPYIRVKLTGVTETETSSLVEAHRLNSPFIISNEDFQKKFVERAKYAKGKPLDWRSIAAAFFHFDPNSLLHGVFMANLEDGRVRLPRAISGFIEAEDVREAASGGVKNNPIDPTGTIRARGIDEDVYSNVPYHRTEFTAQRIVAYFNLDLALLRGYGLGDAGFELLVALALYKTCRFLRAGLRLRTACDLAVANGIRVTSPEGFELPSEKAEDQLLKTATERIKTCAAAGLFAKPPVSQLVVETVRRDRKDKKRDPGHLPEATARDREPDDEDDE
jgi:CRISPR-associated protein Csb1